MIPKKLGTLRDFRLNRLSLVEGRLDIGEEQAVPAIAKTKKYVAHQYSGVRYMIFDSPPGTSCPMMEAVKDADYVILITEPTPFGLHDLKLAVETTRELRKPFGVVINRYGIGNGDVIQYCRQEEIPVLAKIPNSRRIAELSSSGKLVYMECREFEEALDIIIRFFQQELNSRKSS
jgi:MinD superfamily P-loop ATPase